MGMQLMELHTDKYKLQKHPAFNISYLNMYHISIFRAAFWVTSYTLHGTILGMSYTTPWGCHRLLPYTHSILQRNDKCIVRFVQNIGKYCNSGGNSGREILWLYSFSVKRWSKFTTPECLYLYVYLAQRHALLIFAMFTWKPELVMPFFVMNASWFNNLSNF